MQKNKLALAVCPVIRVSLQLDDLTNNPVYWTMMLSDYKNRFHQQKCPVQ